LVGQGATIHVVWEGTMVDSNGDGASDASTGSAAPGSREGFSELEKIAGAGAASEAPLASGLVASALLKNETDPLRRRQLEQFRKASLTWWIVGSVVGLVVLIIVVAMMWSSAGGGASGSCRGGPDKSDGTSTTFQSRDGKHWTATYPCMNGGSTTVPIPKRLVPGAK
jgi:hypothetical protein